MTRKDDVRFVKAKLEVEQLLHPRTKRQRLVDLTVGASFATLFFVALFVLHTVARTPRLPPLGLFNPSHYPPIDHAQDLIPPLTTPLSASPIFDGFSTFRKTPACNFSTNDIHKPFLPKCQDRSSVVQAMTSGGRQGIDAPYQPRDCDMTWFTTADLCRILSKFDRIHVVGDSMMRFLATALHILLRADLADGGRATWRDEEPDATDGGDCHCTHIFGNSKCAWWSAVDSDLVWQRDPTSMSCAKGAAAAFDFSVMLSYPIGNTSLDTFVAKLPTSPPASGKPQAFIMGHGLWNNLEANLTIGWIDQVESAMRRASPFLFSDNRTGTGDVEVLYPKLFITPSAASELKPDAFVPSQNNIMLQRLEHKVGPYVRGKGYDHLGLWNMSIQTTSPDGSHGSMKTNILKAMMVFNWLDKVEV